MSKQNPFANIGYDDFRRLAADPALSKYERIGFPDDYREGFEETIFADILSKLSNLAGQGCRVLDIGPGCSDLPALLAGHCKVHGHHLALVDSAEMLALLPEAPFIEKRAARFPDCTEFIDENQGAFDAILCYSVLHYVLIDVAFFRFLDAMLSLLAPGGQLLIGDIPNVSKRKRFFVSEAGKRFHREFMKVDEDPAVAFNRIEYDQIDDAVVMALLQRARAAGFDAYVLPQASTLPMANRREDILVTRP
jgi:SAM-dependent methyltransferase